MSRYDAARKIAYIYKKEGSEGFKGRGASEKDFNAVLQKYTAQAQIKLDELTDMIERSKKLVDQSNKKDHIYAEAGDMIQHVDDVLKGLRDAVETLSYLGSRKEYRDVENKLSPDVKEYIDEVVKHSDVSLHGSSETPDAGTPNFIGKDEPHLKTDQRSDEGDYTQDQSQEDDVEDMVEDDEMENTFKNQDGPRHINDWSDSDISYNRPDGIDDKIRFH
jgi:hypothetical protein